MYGVPFSFTKYYFTQKIENVYRTLQNPKVILSSDLLKGFHSDVISKENIINIEDLRTYEPQHEIFQPKETDTAFIQFSSGSTGDPKGIVLTHKNILTNLAAICVGLDVYDSDIFTNWMPLYHDLGLFGCHLCPIFSQANQYLIDPIDFVKKPSTLLMKFRQVPAAMPMCPMGLSI